MTDIGSRIQRAISELSGNEALLGMLDAAAASAMLDWGIKMSESIVRETDGLDDFLADLSLVPRLKAVRSSMRSIGNWAVGKYVEVEDRVRLREKLLENFKTILGESARIPTAHALDEVLNEVDEPSTTPHQLIQKLMQLVTEKNQGEF